MFAGYLSCPDLPARLEPLTHYRDAMQLQAYSQHIQQLMSRHLQSPRVEAPCMGAWFTDRDISWSVRKRVGSCSH